MKSVLISIQPKWCELIASGKKTIEVRKNRPRLETPFKCYIYCTYGQGLIEYHDSDYPNMLLDQKVSKDSIWGNCCNGKVIGEFVCELILDMYPPFGNKTEGTCLEAREMYEYAGGYGWVRRPLCGWFISNLEIYDTPKELSEFGLTRAPQSWCYVEGGESDG